MTPERPTASPHLMPDLRLVSMVTVPEGGIYATAFGKGIVELVVAPTPAHELRFELWASGHLAAGRLQGKTVLYAGDATFSELKTAFTRVFGYELPTGTRHYFHLPLAATHPGVGHDDLTTIPASVSGNDDLYAIADGVAPNKQLVMWNPADPKSLDDKGIPPSRTPVDLGPSAGSRIAYSIKSKRALITYVDAFEARDYKPGDDAVGTEVHPLQILPAAIAATASAFHVLETGSSTITVIPARPDGKTTIDVAKLEAYRRLALAAYMKMLGRLAQYVKDCACQHLLVDCPTGEGKVYLADVSFKDGRVYQICNFGRRRYVHTFPTVEYWLSIAPLIPFVKDQIEKLCCTVLTDHFDQLVEPSSPTHKVEETVSLASMRAGLGYLLTTDLGADLAARKADLATFIRGLRMAVIQRLRIPVPGHRDVRPPDPPDEPAAAPAETAPARTAPPARGAAPADLGTLLGRSLGWRRGAPTQPPPPADDVAELRRDLAAMREKMEDLEKALAALRSPV